MATATTKEPGTALAECREVTYTPLGEANATRLSVGMVRMFLAIRSRSGRQPTDVDVVKFMKLCESRALNPWVGDAYLLGYDNQDGATQWSLITAIQALRKRAEASAEYDGCECGVIVGVASNGQTMTFERGGTVLLDNEKLIGGWAKVHRKDRKVPEYRTVKFSTYDTGKSRWKKDPGGMIVKVAEAAALRAAFPSDLGGLYLRDEFGDNDAPQQVTEAPAGGLARLRAKLEPAPEEPAQPEGVDPPHSDDDAVDRPHSDDDTVQDEPGEYTWGDQGQPPAKDDDKQETKP